MWYHVLKMVLMALQAVLMVALGLHVGISEVNIRTFQISPFPRGPIRSSEMNWVHVSFAALSNVRKEDK